MKRVQYMILSPFFLYPEISLLVSLWPEVSVGAGVKNVRGHEAWPHCPEVVYVVPTGNDSLQIKIRSTVMLATPSNTFRPCCRPLPRFLDILEEEHVLSENLIYSEVVVFFSLLTRYAPCSVNRAVRNRRKIGQSEMCMRNSLMLHLSHPKPQIWTHLPDRPLM